MSTWLTQLLGSIGKPFQWWVVIAAWEAGLLVRLGKTTKLLSPGIHFRIPFLDRVYSQSVRLRIMTTTNQTMATSDGKVVTVSFAVQFAISDLVKLYHEVANPEHTLLNFVLAKSAKYISAHASTDLRPGDIEESINKEISELNAWGLNQLQAFVTGFAFVRTYRLLSNDYMNLSGLDLERENTGLK
jgi:regulator of protease activity HflC (stomatin/prohibitin superfamily)